MWNHSYKEWRHEPWFSAYQITGDRTKAIELVRLMQCVKGIDRSLEPFEKPTILIFDFER